MLDSMDKQDSVILKLCSCKRIFNPLTGDTNSIEVERWIPPTWKPSKQPCRVCNVEYYHEMHLNNLEKLEYENYIKDVEKEA